MVKKTAFAFLLCTATVLGSGTAAFAGERTGTGTHTQAPTHARSACAFSGLEDFDSEAPIAPVDPGVVQNWGHVKRDYGLTGGANSVATPFGEEGCNAHLYPNQEKQ